ncbi:TPA: P-loop NTPase fold protein [Vibrio parahaemolyticus]
MRPAGTTANSSQEGYIEGKEQLTKNHDYSFEILHEQVASTDLFEDQTHESVAATLGSLISKAERGVTVGLEGSWGSGKSTVINLLRGKLNSQEDQKSLFYVFDAWAHDGDPLRKIFLENLINAIDPKENDEHLQDIKNRVSARTKSVKVKTEKSASRLGKQLSWSALLIPVGAALLSATNFESLVPPWHENAGVMSYSLAFGLLFSFFPLFVTLGWSWLWGDKDENNKTKWDIFESEAEENYTQDITEDGERTSIEFEKFFNQILSHVFDVDSSYQFERAVIVIDNLDRVDPQYAQSIWSTLQTFFQHRSSFLNGKDLNWKEKLWFLIPYDREGIRRIWDSRVENEDLGNSIVSSSFMEKCFQVVMEVPSPVMSAWIDYLKKCVNKALYGWPESSRNELIECYIQCMSKLDSSPTPRQIHTLINRAGMLGLRWKSGFSAETLCLYSLYRQSLTEHGLRERLLDHGIPLSFPTLNSEELVKSELAGLLFGVPAQKGVQLLLSPEIKSGIRNGEGERLRELADTHKDAFWLAWRASSSEWQVTDNHVEEYKLNAVNAIHEAFYDRESRIRPYIKQIEKSFMTSFDRWELDKYSYSISLKKLIDLSSNSTALLSNLQDKVQNKLSKVINGIDSDKFPESELVNLSEIIVLLKEKGKPIKTYYYETLDNNKWKKWLQYCRENEVTYDSVLPNQKTFAQLIPPVGFNLDNINKEEFSYLYDTYSLYSEPSVWSNLPTTLVGWFNLPNREFNFDNVYYLALQLISKVKKQHRDAIFNCVKGAQFWARSQHAQIEQVPSLPYLTVICDPDFRSNTNVSNNVKSYFDGEFKQDELETAFNYFKAADAVSDIWYLASDERNKFAIEIIRNIPEAELFSDGADNLDEIAWQSEEELKLIVSKLCENGAVKNIYNDMSKNLHAYNKIIKIIFLYGDESSKKFVDGIIEKMTKEEWTSAIEKNSDLLDCIPDNCTNFSKAWEGYFIGLAKGDIDGSQVEDIGKLLGLKSKVLDLHSIVIPNILDSYFDGTEDDKVTDSIFSAIKELSNNDLRNIERKKYELRLGFWIENNQTERINWLLEADIDTSQNPLEQSIAIISKKIDSSSEEERVLFTTLNDKLKLNIDIGSLNIDDDRDGEYVLTEES